jgi:hypothetical protein
MRIDYGELKRRIRLAELLSSIGWASTEGRGEQLRGPCPLAACNPHVESGSKPTARSFSVHVGKNVYCCFHCGSRGNVLDFWSSYRQQTLRESALELNGYIESRKPT